MTVLVTGAAGQVGSEVVRALRAAELPVTGLGRDELDVCDASRVAQTIGQLRPSLVVNCAAYTAVDRAESEEAQAFAVNAAGARNVAEACREAGAALLHFSTDYVFSGDAPRPYREEERTAPLNAYGRSKLAGEAAIREVAPEHVILRTSWVFGVRGANFVRSILAAMRRGEALRVVHDQRGGPTPAAALGAATARLVPLLTAPSFDAWGTYHFQGEPAVSWYEFALAVRDALPADAAVPRVAIHPIDSAERGGTPRPANSVLDTSRARAVLALDPPDWRASLPAAVAALIVQAEALRKP